MSHVKNFKPHDIVTLGQLVRYDVETNQVYRVKNNKLIKGSLVCSNGTKQCLVGGILYTLHKLAYYLQRGVYPHFQITPDDGDFSNLNAFNYSKVTLVGNAKSIAGLYRITVMQNRKTKAGESYYVVKSLKNNRYLGVRHDIASAIDLQRQEA